MQRLARNGSRRYSAGESRCQSQEPAIRARGHCPRDAKMHIAVCAMLFCNMLNLLHNANKHYEQRFPSFIWKFIQLWKTLFWFFRYQFLMYLIGKKIFWKKIYFTSKIQKKIHHTRPVKSYIIEAFWWEKICDLKIWVTVHGVGFFLEGASHETFMYRHRQWRLCQSPGRLITIHMVSDRSMWDKVSPSQS